MLQDAKHTRVIANLQERGVVMTQQELEARIAALEDSEAIRIGQD